MADSKSAYSSESSRYIKDDVPSDPVDFGRYYRAQSRKAMYGYNWEANAVNINDIVKIYFGNGKYKTYTSVGGIKYVMENEKYKITCDKVGGYLKIEDKATGLYYTKDGKLSSNGDIIHLKIKKREDM